jgi:hypothetical protein
LDIEFKQTTEQALEIGFVRFRGTMKLHGCSFIEDGAHRAASVKLPKVSGSTDVEAKARTLRRPAIKE